VPTGEVLYTQGGAPDVVYFLIEGSCVSVKDCNAKGLKEALAAADAEEARCTMHPNLTLF